MENPGLILNGSGQVQNNGFSGSQKSNNFLSSGKTVSFSKLSLLDKLMYLFTSAGYNVATALYHTIYRFAQLGPN